ncbi:MAG: hypothetical protein N2971_01250 [Chlorobi bacterium]|nr:hypothetical protein [Chlorobiota bacterium]
MRAITTVSPGVATLRDSERDQVTGVGRLSTWAKLGIQEIIHIIHQSSSCHPFDLRLLENRSRGTTARSWWGQWLMG